MRHHDNRGELDRVLRAQTIFRPETHAFHKKPVVLGSFGEEVQTSQGALWFLTSGLCEDTGLWNAQVFAYFGADYQHPANDADSWYPLTKQEEHYITPDGLVVARYPTELRTGYTVWWQAQKWACPTLEYCYAPQDPADQLHGLAEHEVASREILQAFVESEAERLLRELARHDGATVLLDLESVPDRFVLHLLVPMKAVLESYPTLEAWMLFLASLFPEEVGMVPAGSQVYLGE